MVFWGNPYFFRLCFLASAVLAIINEEISGNEVIHHLKQGVISTVNFSETIAMLRRANIAISEARALVRDLFSEIVLFDEEQACLAAEFKINSKQYGLSFGDCACLALAKVRNLAVLTADRAWKEINLGINVVLIR